jgi:hypothetical protein
VIADIKFLDENNEEIMLASANEFVIKSGEVDELGNVIKETEPEESLMLVLPYADLQEFLTKKVKMVLDYKLENEKQKNIFLKSTDWLDLKVMFHIDATMVINPETIN